MPHKFLLLAVTLGIILCDISAYAVILPYSTRARDYSSWTPAAKGDINSIGMAGATVATPINVSAAEPNPAGYAMLTSSVTAQINRIGIYDKRLQKTGEPVDSSQWGFGISPEHWGLSLSYYSPQTESGVYASPITADTAKTEVSMKELRLIVARAFFNDTLAIGASADLLKAVREINEDSANSFGVGYHLGALYKLPHHFLIGASFTPQAKVQAARDPDPLRPMPGFNRAVVRPLLASWGAGWIPNRFFKIGASVTYAGTTQNTALLGDQSVLTGTRPTWVPRLGTGYVFAEYENIKVEAAVGAYYEMSRLSGLKDRLHGTGGLEVNPFFMNIGAGIDMSKDYRNLMVSIGVDVVRTARAFNIIPKDPVAPLRRPWPDPFEILADGLPSGFVRGEKTKSQSIGLDQMGKIIEEVPGNITKKVSGEKTTIEERNGQ